MDIQSIVDALRTNPSLRRGATFDLYGLAGKLGEPYRDVLDTLEAADALKPAALAALVGKPAAPSKPEARRLTNDEIRAIGPLLYGSRWIADLARAMNLSIYAVKFWNNERSQPPAKHTATIIALLCERRDAIDAALKALE